MRLLCLALALALSTTLAAQEKEKAKAKTKPAAKHSGQAHQKPTPDQIRRFNELQKKQQATKS